MASTGPLSALSWPLPTVEVRDGCICCIFPCLPVSALARNGKAWGLVGVEVG